MLTCEDAVTPLEKYLTDEFCKIWRVLKATDRELRVYQNAALSILSGETHTAEDLESYVIQRRQAPDLEKTLNDKYAAILHSLINGLPERAPHTDSVIRALEDLDKPEEEVSF